MKIWTLKVKYLTCFRHCGAWEWFEGILLEDALGKVAGSLVSPVDKQSVSPTGVAHLIKACAWGHLANLAVPLGNLDPYFTFNVSKTFFDMSIKPFLSHIFFFFFKLFRGLGRSHSGEKREALGSGWDGTPLRTSGLHTFCSVPPTTVENYVSLAHL